MRKPYFSIGGSKENFVLEHRIFNTSSFFITAFALAASTLNWVIDLHINTIWPGYAGALASGIIYFFARFKGYFTNALVITYVFLTMVILGGIYFFNDGLGGTIIYLLIMLLNIYLLIVTPRYIFLIFSILGGTVFLLLSLEYFYPEWIIGYPDKVSKILDHVGTLLISMLFTTFIIAGFRRAYIRERNTVLKQNQDLVYLNKHIDEQKAELEKRAAELQQAVEVAGERNERIETLLKELHHRVKNNMQVISGLLSLQSNRLEEGVARESLEASRTRIEAMALIHKGLYQEQDAASVQISDYLVSLNESLANSFGFHKEVIETVVDMQDNIMDIDRAVPVGLIVNELVSNSFKYAFHHTSLPKVTVVLQQTNHKNFILRVSDNGIGKPVEETKGKGSFGLKLVRILADQLNAEIKIENQEGTHFTLQTKVI